MKARKLLQLQKLLLELQDEKPELTFLITDVDQDRLYELQHENDEFFCNAIVQIDCCLDDEDNDILG